MPVEIPCRPSNDRTRAAARSVTRRPPRNPKLGSVATAVNEARVPALVRKRPIVFTTTSPRPTRIAWAPSRASARAVSSPV
jgi:hypothetical protein